MKEIRLLGDPVLREKARPVRKVNAKVRALADEMIAAMEAANGVGLAAPQVGEPVRLIVLSVPRGDLPNFRAVLANPEIVAVSRETSIGEEGCLSIPGVVGEVERAAAVRVRGLAMNGRRVEHEAQGLVARAIQHEVDHLDGVLFIDRIGLAEDEAKAEMERFLAERAREAKRAAAE